MSAGYVYVLSNPSMPGLLKIGRSIRGGAARGQAFYQTGVPERFVLEFEIYTPEHEAVELMVHDKLAEFRTNPGREFFKCEPSQAIEAALSIYLSDCLGNGAILVDEFMHSGAVDLMFMAHKYNLHWSDVIDAVTHLSEFAVRKAVEEMLIVRAKRRAEMASRVAE